MIERTLLILLVMSCTAIPVGCGSQSKPQPKPSVQTAPESAPSVEVPSPELKATQTAAILAKIMKIELACAENTLHLEQIAELSKDNDPLRNAYLKAVKTGRADVKKLRQSIYEHSEFTNPKINEIRHDELDHDDLTAQLDAIDKTLSAALDASRERRTSNRWGSVSGKILISEIPPPRKPLIEKGRNNRVINGLPDESLLVDPSTGGIANVVIYLPIKPSKIHKDLIDNLPEQVTCELKEYRFHPHILVWNTSQFLTVVSSDDVAHEVTKYGPKNNLVREIVEKGRKGLRMHAYEPEIVNVRCKDLGFHGEGESLRQRMSAYWVITDNPYVAITKEDGSFEIPMLPVGDHEFLVWHESSKKIRTGDNPLRVTVEADKTTEIPALTIPVDAFSQ